MASPRRKSECHRPPRPSRLPRHGPWAPPAQLSRALLYCLLYFLEQYMSRRRCRPCAASGPPRSLRPAVTRPPPVAAGWPEAPVHITNQFVTLYPSSCNIICSPLIAMHHLCTLLATRRGYPPSQPPLPPITTSSTPPPLPLPLTPPHPPHLFRQLGQHLFVNLLPGQALVPDRGGGHHSSRSGR